MNATIEDIYRTLVVRDAQGNEYPLDSNIDAPEGRFLSQFIARNAAIKTTLEVGCAYGLSSLHICEALRERDGASHVIVDPDQMSAWHGVGVANLARENLNFFELVLEPSEIALPRFLHEGRTDFDLIFIDGWHTFDQTLVDLYYANRMVRTGGYVIVDDCDRVSVAKAVSYILHYPNYQRVATPYLSASSSRIGRIARALLPQGTARNILPGRIYDAQYLPRTYPSMVAMRKLSEDKRSWLWYKGF